MSNIRKIMTVTDQIDRALTHIYNAALKQEGLALLNSVNTVRNGVVEEPMELKEKQKVSDE